MSNVNTNPYAGYSSGDSQLTSDYQSIPEDMTEERAMQIWLARDHEIEEERIQLHRDRRLRSQWENNQHQDQSGDFQWENNDAYQHRQQQQQLAQREEAHREQQQRQLQQAYRAQTQHQEAVERERQLQAIAAQQHHHAMLEERRSQAIAAQRYAMLEAHAHGGRSSAAPESYFPSQRNDYESSNHLMMGGDSHRPQAQDASLADQVREYERLSGMMGGNVGSQDAGLAAQAQEFERLSLAHRTQDSRYGRSSPPLNISTPGDCSLPANNDTTDEEKKNKKGGVDNSSAYVGTPHPSEYNIVPIHCYLCRTNLYTHPLATKFFCQVCCRISVMQVEEVDPGTKFEQKMADVGDEHGDIDMKF
jgi:hypothetical protein